MIGTLLGGTRRRAAGLRTRATGLIRHDFTFAAGSIATVFIGVRVDAMVETLRWAAMGLVVSMVAAGLVTAGAYGVWAMLASRFHRAHDAEFAPVYGEACGKSYGKKGA